jgi:hypothetical protein
MRRMRGLTILPCLRHESKEQVVGDKFYCDPCAKKEQDNLDANSAEIFTIFA